MDTGRVYNEYCALKAHFGTSYDYFKYQGRIRSGDLNKRNDKHMFFRLSRSLNDQQIKDFFLANILNDQVWIGNMSNDITLEWKKKMVRLPEIFERDLLQIKPIIGEKVKNGQHPKLFQMLLANEIALESFILLDKYCKFIQHYDTLMDGDVVWESWSKRIRKYQPFFFEALARDYPNQDFKTLVKRTLLNNKD